MKNILIGFLLSVASLSVNAICLKTEDYQGLEIKEYNQYYHRKIGTSDSVIDLVFNGVNSGIAGTGFKCIQPDSSVLLMHCENYSKGKGYIDSWSVDLKNKVVFYTKHVSGFSEIKTNGISVYLGRVVGSCSA